MVIFKIDKQETKIIVHIGNTHDGKLSDFLNFDMEIGF